MTRGSVFYPPPPAAAPPKPSPCVVRACVRACHVCHVVCVCHVCRVVKEDESVDWKERYRTTYHFRKGIFMGDRKKNEITIRLDSACLVAEEPALALTGEVRTRAPPNGTG